MTTRATDKKTDPKAAENKTKAKRTTSAKQTAAATPVIEQAANTDEPLHLERVLATVQQAAFTKAIDTTIGVIPLKQGHAALLDRIRLTTDQAAQTLTLTGFNLVLGLEVSIPANVEGSGDWTVNASKLQKLMQNFPTGAVTIGWAPSETMSVVSRTAGPFDVATRLADDCPTIPVPGSPQSFVLKNLRWGLGCALTCAGAEDFRCVHMNFWAPPKTKVKADAAKPTAGVTLTATKQSAVLAYYFDTAEGTDLDLPDRGVAVAGESLQKLMALLNEHPCRVELDSVSSEDVVVRFVITHGSANTQGKTVAQSNETPPTLTQEATQTVFTCRTDKAESVNGNEFMPPTLPVEISFDRDQMVKALCRQAVFTDKQAAVTLDIGGSEVTLTSAGAGIGNGTDTLSAQVKGGPMAIKFDPELLLECLKQLLSSQARLSMSAATEAAYVRDSERDDLFFVLMPAA
ncbi:hypothetical protein H6F76_03380 [Leptolyngbya sp. FACHB-321]|uniref:hypothetical protein n=1 Tax=Leptolyngbya sp. FACHB-321 TaxID=2692807 RepID=UPI00168308A6|nr:hypothetical protein [Leptolyngbya sp. FACHB-321]MBD2034090.1 hypothetical protein [Leptolyngbya sp. FACHB-321]